MNQQNKLIYAARLKVSLPGVARKVAQRLVDQATRSARVPGPCTATSRSRRRSGSRPLLIEEQHR
jgi:hypothetical protein